MREPYEKRFYWWELVALARRTLLVALIVFLATSRPVQLLAVVLATMAALFVHRELMPYRESHSAKSLISANYLELAVLGFHLFLASTLTVLEQPYGDGTASALTALVLIPSLALLSVVARKAWHRHHRASSSADCSQRSSIDSMLSVASASVPQRFASLDSRFRSSVSLSELKGSSKGSVLESPVLENAGGGEGEGHSQTMEGAEGQKQQ
jgi:hypothetical protein